MATGGVITTTPPINTHSLPVREFQKLLLNQGAYIRERFLDIKVPAPKAEKQLYKPQL
jgi:hypothetical protein